MCTAPKIKAPPPPAQYQAMQAPKDISTTKGSKSRRRGFWASVMTGPGGIAAAPTTTGGFSGVTGG